MSKILGLFEYLNIDRALSLLSSLVGENVDRDMFLDLINEGALNAYMDGFFVASEVQMCGLVITELNDVKIAEEHPVMARYLS